MKRLSNTLLLLVVVLSITSLIGWRLSLDSLTRISVSFKAIRPLTALFFILSSVTIFIRFLPVKSKFIKIVGYILITLLLLGASTELLHHLFSTGWNVDILINELFFVGDDIVVREISNLSLILFIILSTLLIWYPKKNSKYLAILYRIGLFLVFFTSFIFLIAYIENLPQLYGKDSIPNSLITTINFILISLVLLIDIEFDIWPLSYLNKKATLEKRLIIFYLPTLIGLLLVNNMIESVLFSYTNDHIISSLGTLIILLPIIFIVLFNFSKIFGKKFIIANERIRETEKRFQNMVKLSPGAVAIHVDGIIVYVNPAAVKIAAASSASELIGEPILNFIHPDYQENALRRIENMFKSGEDAPFIEEQFIALDGSIVYTESASALIKHKGMPAVLTILRDITKHKLASVELQKAKEKAEASEQRLEEIAENIEEVFWAVNPNTSQLLYVSPAIEKLWGLSIKQAANDPFIRLDYIHPDDKEYYLKNLITRSNGVYKVEFRIKTPDGNIKWLYEYGKPVYNETGELIRVLGTTMDITQRKELELKIKEQQRKLKTLIGNLPGMVYRCKYDKDWTMEFIGGHCLELTGYESTDFLNNAVIAFNDIIHPNFKYASSAKWQEVIKEQKHFYEEYKIICKNGEEKWVLEHGVGVYNEVNELVCFEGFIQDITDSKLASLAIEQAKEIAEQNEQFKSIFIANMTHEIRTPMSGILGFTELLKTEDLAREKQLKFIDIIEKSGNRLLHIVNNIVDISKIESGQMQSHIVPTNITEQLNFIYDFFKLEAKNKGIELRINNLLKTEEEVINTDAEKVYAVLTNLVKNALKFTDMGSVEMGCERKGELLQFYVKDTGNGIPQEHLSLIFERFKQSGDKFSQNKGTGLGLSISKSYIEMLGGEIWVTSEEGKGATFYFTLPYIN